MTDESRAMIHHLKYEGLWRLADDLSQVMTRCMGAPPPGVLIPIPLADRRLGARGYNQAYALAEGLGARWHRTVRDNVLRRVSETRSQTTVSASERAANVAGAFHSLSPRDASGVPVILVDDVFTTGATLASAAGALERAGWTEIHAVTFARAMPYEVSVGQ